MDPVGFKVYNEAVTWHQRHTWTPASVSQAISDHTCGQFERPAQLKKALDKDPRVNGCLTTRCSALTAKNGGFPFSLIPSDRADGRVRQSIASRCESWWWESVQDWQITRILRDAVPLGIAFGQRVPVLLDGEWIPTLVPWDPANLRWNWQENKWNVRTREGDVISFSDGDPSWYVYLPYGPRGWDLGVIGSIAHASVMRSDAYKDWARYCERHGLPIIGVKEPRAMQAQAEDADTFAQSLYGISSGAIVRLPQGETPQQSYALEMIEPKDSSWQAFKEFSDALARDIMISIKGQNITTEIVGGGSYAAASALREIDGLLLAHDAQTLGRFFRDNLLVWWGRWNVPGWRDSWAPWPTWDVEAKDSLETTTKIWANVAASVATLNASLAETGQQVDMPKLAEKLGIPLMAGAATDKTTPQTGGNNGLF